MAENDLLLSLLPPRLTPYDAGMKSTKTAGPGVMPSKTVVFLAAPNTQILDVAGPFQVFVRAAELFMKDHPSRKPPYRVLLASTTHRKVVSTNCGLTLTGVETFRSLRGPIDTLLVAGGSGVEEAGQDKELLACCVRPRSAFAALDRFVQAP